ncbi:GTP-binding protein [Neobacillus piezotolerans]|uniref:GTP-binding protein n=1 Tax=Neobacillus piezotolerans TaxID=2259171 RepID=A0A3D8GQQ4_9BACI|nr:tetratricopeptide repeat protein [Neobacillus piezotolerans]RDU36758.1 GTP-binding protein [Neobacillus piezotolerans]
MNLERMLIEKTYYESFMEGSVEKHPALVLAEAYLDARRKGGKGLPEIRFAQGEVYFAFRDYEAAIQKWEGSDGSLGQWAVKNTADAYYELGDLAKAEDLYKSVESMNASLKAEVALQLFSLYIEKGREDAASETIKGLISENPGYPDAAGLARSFFEGRSDWDSATELAANEIVRTKSAEWADILISYVEREATVSYPPVYFNKVLTVLYETDENRFGQLAAALWKTYRGRETYFDWIKEFNLLLGGLDGVPAGIWPELSLLYKESYLDFTTSGNYPIQSLAPIMPSLLSNWLAIEDRRAIGLAASALLAWGGRYPAGISRESVEIAEATLAHSKRTENDFAEGLALISEISSWAEGQGMHIGPRLEWIAGELANFRTRHIVTAGLKGSGKAHVLSQILGESYPEAGTIASSALAFQYCDEAAVSIVTDTGVLEAEELGGLDGAENKNGICTFLLPVPFLKDAGLSIIDLPEFEGDFLSAENLDYIDLADSLFFAVDASDPLTEDQRQALGQIREQAPGLPIHFMLTQSGEPDPHAFEQASLVIKGSFPNSEVIKAGPVPDRERLFESIVKAAVIGTPERSILGSRTDKLLLLIRKTLDHLLVQRAEQEKGIQETIESKEQMAAKLTGAIHQLEDIESERIEKVRKSYRKRLDEAKAETLADIPELLRGTADFIKEDSDFRTVHLSLNDEMNRRLNAYLNETALPKLRVSLGEWLEETGAELSKIQEFLDEMAESFNTLYGREWIRLDCDFRVLDDWQRDIGRMANSYQLDKVNVLLRRTPSQIFLKGAGKLLGALPQNNAMLYNRYKSFVENEDYLDTARLVNERFLMQFDLFEKAISRDLALFFLNPHQVLLGTLAATQEDLADCRQKAADMKKNPARFHDPMALFGIRLRQLEWLEMAGSGNG